MQTMELCPNAAPHVKVLEELRKRTLGERTVLVFDDRSPITVRVGPLPERGEFAFSSGMQLDRGCSHYGDDEIRFARHRTVSAHEMKHAA